MTIRNLDYLFKPSAIALIGDGGDSEVIIARNLMKSGFKAVSYTHLDVYKRQA